MKIAISAALVLGVAGVASAFPCTWNGAGSSYVYEEVTATNDDGGNPCATSIDSAHQQTTCCRCALEEDCKAFGQVDTPTYNSLGCDLYAPTITLGDSAGGAALPGKWFTNTKELERYLQSTVQCKDDCVEQPSCNINIEYGPDNAPLCGNTEVKVTSTDWVGCYNQNTATKNFLVRFDGQRPNVTVTLGDFAYKPLPKEKLEHVPLGVRVEDFCDDYPEVSITVYSDEQPLIPEKTPAALLARTYATTGASNGWNLWLDRKNYATKFCEKDTACKVPSGRFYTVRVCARDQAGWVRCAEDSVGVPLKYSLDKKIDPIDEGKLFVVAEDTIWWNQAPNQFGYRPENTPLDNLAFVNNPDQARLCYTNRNVTGTPLAGGPFPAPNGPDDCATRCQNPNTPACVGFVFEYTNLITGVGTCELYSDLDDADDSTTQNLNIFVIDDNACPDIRITR